MIGFVASLCAVCVVLAAYLLGRHDCLPSFEEEEEE